MARRLMRILACQGPDANYLKKVFQYIREGMELTGQRKSNRRLPELLSEDELLRYYDQLLRGGNADHLVMVKTLLFTGLRNAELVELELRDFDLVALKVRVRQGKGGDDRDVPIPEAFRGELLVYIDRQKCRGARYFLESRLRQPFTTRRVRQVLKKYADLAGIEKRLYPHLFRHQLLTFLTGHGVPDAQLQFLSGHRSRESLALYQTLSLADLQPSYQEAMRRFPIR